MRKKRLIAFLLSACLAVTPVIGVSASGELDVGGIAPSQESAVAESGEDAGGTGEAAGAEGGSAEDAASESNSVQDAAATESSSETDVADDDSEAAEDLAADDDSSAAMGVYSSTATVSSGDALEGNFIAEDFESVTDTWGMEVPGKGTLGVVEDETGNKYLKLTTTEAARTTSKELIADAPEMGSATISFKWYTTTFSSTSNEGYAGIRITDGTNEIVTLFLNDIREETGKQNTTPLYYTVYGSENKVDTGKKIDVNTTHTVELSFDFTAHKLAVKLDGEDAVTDVDFLSTTTHASGLTMITEGTKPSVNMGIDDFFMSWTEQEAAEGTVTVDCGTLDGWSGSLVSESKLSVAEAGGSKYLAMNGEKYATRTAAKSLGELPDMGTATVSFKWYTTSLTSDSRKGTPGITLKSGDVEVVSVYMGEARGTAETEAVYYSVQGTAPTKIPSKTLTTAAAHNVVVSVDFSILKATIFIDGEEYITADVNAAATKVDTLMLNMAGGNGSGKTYTVNMGIGDFSMNYTNAGAIQRAPHIASLGELEAVTATKADHEAGFAHYSKVTAVLSNGTEATLDIDANSWTPDKTFVADDWGSYTWTADVKLPEDGSITNPLNLQVSYEMNYRSDFLDTDINSVVMPQPVIVTKQQWESGSYQHPDKVSALLVNGRVITVSLDAGSWTCEPEFDVDTKGSYVWTADIAATENNRNHRNLKVSYTMNYYGSYVSEHDYENEFTFKEIDWDVWGKDVDKDSGTGGYEFSIKEEADGNLYLYGKVTNNNPRGSRLDLSADIVKGATMEFDWMPVKVGGGHADLLFMSPAAKQNYFTVYVDSSGAIKYYTASDANNTSVIDDAFEGVIAEKNAESTGVGAIGKWFTVKVAFDYINHTADLTVTSKEDSKVAFTKSGIPISPDANGLSVLVMRKPKGCNNSENALDNIYVDYDKFDENDIVSVRNPANINMTKELYSNYKFPETVTAVLGNKKTVDIKVGDWTSEPTFDPEKEGAYVWTAPLVTGNYTNYFKLNASFTMNYTEKPYVSSVNNPPTLELEYGEGWSKDELPKEATVILNTGDILYDAPVGEWNAIRAFDAEKEGIYVYGANLAEDTEGRFVVDKALITPNEQHSADSGYVYDVYYRVSYFETPGNNYNGYVRSMEYLDRGVSAVNTGSGILVSWRLFVEEYGKGVQFNVLRNGVKITSTPITTKTNYLDKDGKPGDKYSVEIIQNGVTTVSEATEALADNYLSIKLQKPEPQPDIQGNLAAYSINDAGVADVDGDGQYEFVIKWYPSDAFDSGKQDGPSAPTIFDFYEMDGTPLWRLNMGLEMPSGAHWNQFMLYDMDEDGKAEFFIKTSDGTVSYKPNKDGLFDMTDESTIVSYIGDKSVVPGTNIASTGHVGVDSNEYVTVFNGLTGEEIDTIDYVNQVDDFEDYGDNWGNRASRFNIALAYLPKTQNDAGCTETIPAVLLNRGYYNRTTIAAYTLRNGKLQLEWNFIAENGTRYAGRGNHNVSTGDMDQDGFDEIVIGALAIDHDGTVLWCKDGIDGQDEQGHSDTIHLSVMNPNNPTQLYVFTPSEEAGSTLNGTLSNAANGSRINGIYREPADIGRGVAANITPNAGFEYWINTPNNEGGPTGTIYNMLGQVQASVPPSNFSTNWRVYWDGDLLSELADGRNNGTGGTDQTVYKYDWENNVLNTMEVFGGTHTNNSTKNTPSLSADLFGDWREEFMVGASDDTELRIYMTGYETEYAIYTLMQDPVYRNAVANQNTAYNQPPHLGFYLGEDNKEQVLAMELPTPKISYTTKPGEFKPSVDKDDVAPDTGFVTDAGKLKNILTDPDNNILDDDEKAAINDGANFELVLQIKDAAESVKEEGIAAKMEEAAGKYNIGLYMDISLLLIVGDKDPRKVKTLGKDEVELEVKLPEELINTNAAVKRTYIIIREHEGVCDVLEKVVYDEKAGTLRFKTDKFSYYAIAYLDETVTEPTQEPGTPIPTQEPGMPTQEPGTPEPTQEPGTTETPAPTQEPGTTETPAPTQEPTSTPDNGGNGGSNGGNSDNNASGSSGQAQQTNAPKIGDHMDGIAVGCVLVIAMAGIGAAVVIKRRRKAK